MTDKEKRLPFPPGDDRVMGYWLAIVIIAPILVVGFVALIGNSMEWEDTAVPPVVEQPK